MRTTNYYFLAAKLQALRLWDFQKNSIRCHFSAKIGKMDWF